MRFNYIDNITKLIAALEADAQGELARRVRSAQDISQSWAERLGATSTTLQSIPTDRVSGSTRVLIRNLLLFISEFLSHSAALDRGGSEAEFWKWRDAWLPPEG